MVENGFVIRQMAKDDVELAVDWAAQEGWNPGFNDAACFYSADPHGFFIGELNGEPIGCVSAVSYGDSFGFIGFYIIRKELRGKWYGVELGKKAMSYLGARAIGIDGVVKKIKNYEKFGFVLAHRNIRDTKAEEEDQAPLVLLNWPAFLLRLSFPMIPVFFQRNVPYFLNNGSSSPMEHPSVFSKERN